MLFLAKLVLEGRLVLLQPLQHYLPYTFPRFWLLLRLAYCLLD